MIPTTPLLRSAARYSRTLATTVDLYRGSTVYQQNLPVISGTLSGDRTDKVRLTCDLTLGLAYGERLQVDNQRSQIRVYQGVPSLGTTERIQLGVFRVDELDYSALGEVNLKCSGMESYVINARLLKPRVPQFAVSSVRQIKQLITEALPSARVRVVSTRDAPLRTRVAWQRERWDAVDALSQFIESETYSDHTGDFIIANAPNLIFGVPVYAITEGVGGVLITRTENDTRAQVYNAVSVSGTSSDPNIPPLWAWAYDSDPNSPTYYWANPQGPAGGFGQVPRFYISGFFTNTQQCQRTAFRMLGDALAQNIKLTFESMSLAFLECGDMVSVKMLDGTTSTHMIQKFSYDLGVDGGMNIDAMSTKVEAREDGAT